MGQRGAASAAAGRPASAPLAPPVHVGGLCLADAVNASQRLSLHRRIQQRLHQHNVLSLCRGKKKIKSCTASVCTYKSKGAVASGRPPYQGCRLGLPAPPLTGQVQPVGALLHQQQQHAGLLCALHADRRYRGLSGGFAGACHSCRRGCCWPRSELCHRCLKFLGVAGIQVRQAVFSQGVAAVEKGGQGGVCVRGRSRCEREQHDTQHGAVYRQHGSDHGAIPRRVYVYYERT
jgi:hypothetical protein